jgi:hypothetical protein
MQTGRQKDMTKATVAFCKFANVPKNGSNFSANVGHHRTKFSHPGDLATGVFAFLM